MSFLPVALLLGILAPVAYFAMRKVYPALVKKKATKQLESYLFPNGNQQKSEIIRYCKELTGSRFKDEEILDYFIKMKGLHIVNPRKTNFWVKKYLLTPAPIKLNYFEQVRFYEMFLNFEENENNRKTSIAGQNKRDIRKIQEKKGSLQFSKQEKPI